VAKEFKMHITNSTVRNGLEYIQKQFESENSEGQHSVARFMFPGNPEAQSRTRLDAFMRLSEFFKYL
jgi:hypothetical protein